MVGLIKAIFWGLVSLISPQMGLDEITGSENPAPGGVRPRVAPE